MTSSAAPANRPALMLPGLEPGFAPKRTGPLIGIDLGTTNSCVAIVERGKPVVLKSRDGYQTIPSVISFTANKLLIGHAAKRQLVPSPETTIHGAKRLVGRPFESSVVEEVRLRSFYTIVPGPDGQAAVSLGGEVYTLEELSALILLDMRMTAEQHLGQPVSRAVITCPAFYSEQQRAAVREAGRLAGLHVERVLNEPTAAALAYGYGKDLKKRIAVFDLGGGTFDATVLSVDGENFEVKATGGDTFLGGIDFDHAVVGHFLTAFEDQHGRPFEGDRVAMQRLVQEAEKAKCAL
ncbi:MAG: Hsp70 family protein, partial [Myxococcota bacterium]